MRALHFDRQLAFHDDYPDPAPAPGESILRVRLAGICGTDLELVRGYMGFRGVPGHEFVADVVDTRNPALSGRRVAGEINASCGACRSCLAGLGRHCPSRTVLGILGRDGAFADYLTLPDTNLHVIPDSIPDQSAVFVEPIAAACEILDQCPIRRNETILVLGAGRLGTLIAMLLRAEGYEAILAGRTPEKLARLVRLKLKVTVEDELAPGFDTVIDCTGNSVGFNRALALVKPRGRLILKSTAAEGAPLNLAAAVVNEINIVGSRCGRFEPAIAALAAGRVDPRPLISATFPLADGIEAFDASRDPSNFKVLLKPQ